MKAVAELLLAGADLYADGALRPLDLLVSGEQIAALVPRGTYSGSAGRVDLSGAIILPGFIDPHFHCRAPGYPEREDFTTGTSAAAAGGITCVLEMPIALPGVHSAEVLNQRRQLGERDAVVDFGLWGGGGASAADLGGMAAAGAIGFKAFLAGPPPERAEEFRGLVASSPAQLLASMAVVSQIGLPFAIHCEDASLVDAGVAAARAAEHIGLRAHADSRPPIAEVVAAAVALELAASVGVRVYLAHMSTGRALQLADDARARGVNVVFETCPHYFLLDSETAEPLGPFAKVNPPLRDRREVAAIWKGVVGGNVDVVGSDHAPYTVAEKERGWSDIFSAPSGSPGAETLGPVLIDLALQNRLPWSRVVELLSGRAAEIFGLSARKGQLAPGLDADCVVIDPQQTWAVERAGFMTRSRDSARMFEGRRLRGRITRVYLRGKPVFADNRVQQAAGYGHFVKPVVT